MKVTLRFHRLFELGFNETHFDILEQHFSDALLDCWSRDAVTKPCKKYFGELREIFKLNGKAVLQMEMKQRRQEERLSQSLREYGTLLGTRSDNDRLIQSEKTEKDLKYGKKKADVPFWRRKVRTSASGSGRLRGSKKPKQTATTSQ